MPEEILICEKIYRGYESTTDIGREIEECFSPGINRRAHMIPDNFKGTIRIRVTYERDAEEEPK